MDNIFDFETGASQSELNNYLNNDGYDFFADPRNDPFYHNDLGTSPSNAQILTDINYDPGNSNIFKTIGSILSGGSGTMAQLAGLGGLGALINKIGGSGSSGGGGFQGYQGGIPEYTASRTQLPIPPSGSQSATPDGQGAPKRRPGSGGVTYFSPMQYLTPGQAPASSDPVGRGLGSLVGGDPSNAPIQSEDRPVYGVPPPMSPERQQQIQDMRSRNLPIDYFLQQPQQQTPQQMVAQDDPFYQSPEFKAYQNDPSNMYRTDDMYMSPYFGQMSSGSAGSAMDRAYEQYRNRSGAQPTSTTAGVAERLPEFIPRAPDGGIIEDFEEFGKPAPVYRAPMGPPPDLSKDEDFKPPIPMFTPEQKARSIIEDVEYPDMSVFKAPFLTPEQQARSIIEETPDMFRLPEFTPKAINTPPEPRPELMRDQIGVSNPRQYAQTYAQGGIANLGGYSDGGRLLRGPGDGVSDDIPAMIGNKQPARLADGEFVIPARIVSEIGNGSTDAGARKLYAMMDRVQKARGKTLKNVAANSKADKYLPA